MPTVKITSTRRDESQEENNFEAVATTGEAMNIKRIRWVRVSSIPTLATRLRIIWVMLTAREIIYHFDEERGFKITVSEDVWIGEKKPVHSGNN